MKPKDINSAFEFGDKRHFSQILGQYKMRCNLSAIGHFCQYTDIFRTVTFPDKMFPGKMFPMVRVKGFELVTGLAVRGYV